MGEELKVRKRIFLAVLWIQLLANADAGILPAVLIPLNAEFQLGYTALGLLGCLVYVGLTVSCPLAGYLFAKMPAKYVVVASILANSLSTLLFGLANSVELLLVARALMGFTQGPIFIYSPVWVDEFSPPGAQTKWMSLLQALVALGIMVGYVIGGLVTSFVGRSAYRICFIIQASLLFPMGIAALFVGNQHVDAAGLKDTDQEYLQNDPGTKVSAKRARRSSLLDVGMIATTLAEAGQPAPPVAITRRARVDSIGFQMATVTKAATEEFAAETIEEGAEDDDEDEEHTPMPVPAAPAPAPAPASAPEAAAGGVVLQPNPLQHAQQPGVGIEMQTRPSRGASQSGPRASRSSTRSSRSASRTASRASRVQGIRHRTVSEAPAPTMCGQVMQLLGFRVFVCITLGLSALYFVVTGIQFWITDYLVTDLGADPATVVIAFAITSLTGPTAGVFFGGWFVDKRGGYKDSTGKSVCIALKCCLGFGVFALACSIITMLVPNFLGVILSLWFVLFFGGALVPPATGICISCVPPALRSTSSAWSMMVYNLLGYAAAPFLCGAVAATAGLTWGFRLVMSVSFLAMISMFLAWIFAEREYAARQKSLESDPFAALPPPSEDLRYEMARRRGSTFTTVDGLFALATADEQE